MELKQYIEENEARFLDELASLIRIPSISALPEHKEDMLACAERWRQLLLKAGADKTLCTDQGISPAAIAQKRGDSALAQKLQISACAPWPVPETDSPSDSVPIESADSQNNSESSAQTSDQGTRP